MVTELFSSSMAAFTESSAAFVISAWLRPAAAGIDFRPCKASCLERPQADSHDALYLFIRGHIEGDYKVEAAQQCLVKQLRMIGCTDDEAVGRVLVFHV